MGRRHGKPSGAMSISQLLQEEGLVGGERGPLPEGFKGVVGVQATFGEDYVVDPGDVVHVDKLEKPPEFLLLNVGGARLYTVVMVDVDHPSPDEVEPTHDSQLIHVLITNIPAKSGSSREGDMVMAYGPPSRYTGTGDHRYLMVALEQPAHLNLVPPRHRIRFDLSELMRTHYLTPVGATYLIGKHGNHKQPASPTTT